MSTAGVIPIISANADPDLCTPCGGQCCSHYPGVIFPEQISATFDEVELLVNIDDMLKTGRWALDYCERFDGNETWTTYYFPRPAIKDNEGQRVHKSHGGGCTFQGEAGCELSAEKRPLECLSLVPKKGGLGHCVQTMPHRAWEKAWAPFNKILEALR